MTVAGKCWCSSNDGERTPSETAGSFDFTLPALSTHLRVLRESGLVLERREARIGCIRANRQAVSDLMGFFDNFWDDELDKLKEHVEGRSRRKEG
jgi:ArsR family transcriptional regulator, arsenate/arsenite/antimonite-responsive transcriptional repressor